MVNLTVKIGVSPQELVEAKRLRYEVFHVEIKGEKPTAEGLLDEDRFDDICEHLVVIDKTKGCVVGTYRLLLEDIAEKNFGFYTETKFNIDSLKRLPGKLLEVGRSCVHRDYRNRVVLNLMWEGIANFAKKHGVRYIFGASNIMTGDIEKISQYWAMFHQLGIFVDKGVKPANGKEQIPLKENVSIDNPKRLFVTLPTLFKGYMNVGLKVCGVPVQGDFGTALFPVILDIKEMNPVYKKKFFGSYLDEETQ